MRSAFLLLSADEGELVARSLPAALAGGFDDGLVIDNACSDDTPALAELHGVRRLRLEQRVSYAAAMNAGLRALGEEVDAVALLTGDTFIDAGYRAAGVAVLERDGSVAAVAPKLIRTLGREQSDRLEVLDAAGMFLDRRRKNGLVGHGEPAGGYCRPAPVFGADGAAAFWRVSALADCEVQGQWFDEAFQSWASDVDLSWRAQLLGWRAVYEPAAIVHHIRSYSPSTRARMPAADRRTQFRNRLLMIAKNDRGGDLLRDLVPILSYEVLALGFALIQEPELLAGYGEAWRGLPEARRWRRTIQARRRRETVPFGLLPAA